MNRLIEHIASNFKAHKERVFLVSNKDKFLFRPDVQRGLKEFGLDVFHGNTFEQRLRYELRDHTERLILLSYNLPEHLEDIRVKSIEIIWSLADCFPRYHRPSLDKLNLELLEDLFIREVPYEIKNKEETLTEIKKRKLLLKHQEKDRVNLVKFEAAIKKELEEAHPNWMVIARLLANGLNKSIGTDDFDEVYQKIHEVNKVFIDAFESLYELSKTASVAKKPTIVSNVLDYLSFNFIDDKIALIVIDGMAFWQYLEIKSDLNLQTREEAIYSWVPSITELSRQALFRGALPEQNYIQGPRNEEKLWTNYWQNKNIASSKIKYVHNGINEDELEGITKLGVVFTYLDEKMHGADNYRQLSFLTEEWLKSGILKRTIEVLKEQGFRIFITTDHGNIQAKGWQKLTQKEKMGMITTGSKGERFIEYPNARFKDELLAGKPDLIEFSSFKDSNGIYLNNDLSFTDKESIVSHGGTHILEVLIPFIEIIDEE